jgi:hypothetical protein
MSETVYKNSVSASTRLHRGWLVNDVQGNNCWLLWESWPINTLCVQNTELPCVKAGVHIFTAVLKGYEVSVNTGQSGSCHSPLKWLARGLSQGSIPGKCARLRLFATASSMSGARPVAAGYYILENRGVRPTGQLRHVPRFAGIHGPCTHILCTPPRLRRVSGIFNLVTFLLTGVR